MMVFVVCDVSYTLVMVFVSVQLLFLLGWTSVVRGGDRA